MRYTLLGSAGLRVSELCLGTMTFGADWGWGADESQSRKQVEIFAAAGGTSYERELLPMARGLGLGVTTWGPLGAGLLTGKYDRRQPSRQPRRLAEADPGRLDEVSRVRLGFPHDFLADTAGLVYGEQRDALDLPAGRRELGR